MSDARTIEDVVRDPRSTAEIQRAVDAFDTREWPSRSRVHVLRNFTIETALAALRFAGYRSEIQIDATLSGFDAYRQEALVGGGDFDKADAIVLWLWLEGMPMAWSAEGLLDPEGARAELFGVIDEVSSRSSAPILVHTFVAPVGRGPHWEGHDALDALNRLVRDRARSDRRLVLVDVARLAQDSDAPPPSIRGSP